MANYRRCLVPGGIYFFTLVTWQRNPFFESPPNIELLRLAFRNVMKGYPFSIDAIVVLPDHIHAIWQLPEGDSNYSNRWREIKKQVSRNISAPVNRRGEKEVWQRRFWEHTIRDEDDWHRHMDYIHFNPVKHGLVEKPGDWPYSSFNTCVRKGLYEADWGRSAESISISHMWLE